MCTSAFLCHACSRMISKLSLVAWWRQTGAAQYNSFTDCCGCSNCCQPLADKLGDGVAKHSQRPEHEAQHYGMRSDHSFSAAVHKHVSAAEAYMAMLLDALNTVY